VTHDVEFVAECNPTILLVSNGQIIDSGPSKQILTDEQLVEKCSLTVPQIGRLMGLLAKHGANRKVVDVYSAVVEIKDLLRSKR
jgi:hypothetical protein